MPLIKVSSSDITNLPFLRKVAAKGKPVVLSTRASTLGEIDMAVQALTQGGCAGLALLHCVLNYPTLDHNAHLGMISGLRRVYPELVVGYSDHALPDPGLTPLVCAYLLGARILEKHFTHDKRLPGNDHYHAMDADDLAGFCRQMEKVRTLLGPTRHKRPLESEAPARAHARRSIVLKRALRAGEALREDSLTYKRPASGISPTHWDEVLGRRAGRDLPEDHVLQWRDLELPDES